MKPFLIGNGETDLEKRSDLHEAARLVNDWAASDPMSPDSWTRGLQSALCWPETCLPSFHACEGEGKTTGSAAIPRVGKDLIAFAERTVRLSIFSLWELVGHLQKAWEEQLMKRSNSLENCLTLLLYFWISTTAKDG